MTPSARIAAAIEIYDQAAQGVPLEKVFKRWAQKNRYAGSKDRVAIRDIVYEAWRCRRSFGFLGGGSDGRSVMLGRLRSAGLEPAEFFDGSRFGPGLLSSEEMSFQQVAMPEAVGADIPDWQIPMWERRYGKSWPDHAQKLRRRAPVFLRVNVARTSLDEAVKMLLSEGIKAFPHESCQTALKVRSGERKISTSSVYRNGFVELQDLASQLAASHLPLKAGMRVLDYCAGGGGKALALAARETQAEIWAHDISSARMKDIPQRAARAGSNIPILGSEGEINLAKRFDLILCDVPCSGSGSWRRDPEGKWNLKRSDYDELQKTQLKILHRAERLLTSEGTLAYLTCSVFLEENRDMVNRFLASSREFKLCFERQFDIGNPSDGFWLSVMTRGPR